MKRQLKRLFLALLTLAVLTAGGIWTIDSWVAVRTEDQLFTAENIPDIQVDAVLVLGARVYASGDPSTILEDRLISALAVYESGAAKKILVSGDHGTKYYNEVRSMKDWLVSKGVPAKDIFMDHAGFSTYESVYRARDVFQVETLVIATQDYHVRRAVYTANALGMKAYGVQSDRHIYPGMPKYRLREALARVKDFTFVHILYPEPTYLGDPYPITGDGRETDI